MLCFLSSSNVRYHSPQADLDVFTQGMISLALIKLELQLHEKNESLNLQMFQKLDELFLLMPLLARVVNGHIKYAYAESLPSIHRTLN